MKLSSVKRKAETFRRLAAVRDFTGMARGAGRNIRAAGKRICTEGVYFCAAVEDIRTGGRCRNRKVPSRYGDMGAFAMQNSDYRCVEQLFRTVPLRECDVYVDVGCGEGRTLTYHASKGFRGKEYGVELDPVHAATAAKRTRKWKNTEIVCGNILEQDAVIREGTAFFLYNPFDETVLAPFLDLVEKEHPANTVSDLAGSGPEDSGDEPASVRLYYFCDYYRDEIDRRENWSVLWSGMTQRKPFCDLPATIFEYTPRQSASPAEQY